MSRISRLTRLEEMLRRKKAEKEAEADRKLHRELLSQHMQHHRPAPVTRRTFLESGVLSMSSLMLGPSIGTILGSLPRSAAAQALLDDCPKPPTMAAGGAAAFINIHLSGGFQTLAAATPRMINGARLGSYSRLGLPTDAQFVNNAFVNGAEFFDYAAAINPATPPNEGFIRGLQNGAGDPAILAQAAFVTVPIRDNGDSDQRFSILGLVDRAGRAGVKTGFLRQGGDTDTGINGDGAFNVVTRVNPLNIGSTQAIINAIRPSGALANLTLQQQESMARTIQNLNADQAARLTGVNGGTELSKLVMCATDQNMKNLQDTGPAIDPAQVTGMPGIWGNFAGTGGNGTGGGFNNGAIAAIVNNVLNGNSAGAAINVGGYDIHANGTNDRTAQEQGAFNIGQVIGRMLASARLLNQRIFVHITTNGSVVNADGNINGRFNDDDNQGNCFGASHFIMYDPARAMIPVANLPAQIGGLNANGNVDNTTFTSVVQDGEAAVFYNYCLFSGNEALFDQVMSRIKTYSAAQKALMRKVA